METIGEKAEGKSLTRSVTKKSTQKRRITNCESCMNYEYDEAGKEQKDQLRVLRQLRI